jgi:hypothetical protein
MTVFLRRHGISDTVLSYLTTPVPYTSEGTVSPIARSLQFIVKNVFHRHIEIPNMIPRDWSHAGGSGNTDYRWNNSNSGYTPPIVVDSDIHRLCESCHRATLILVVFHLLTAKT